MCFAEIFSSFADVLLSGSNTSGIYYIKVQGRNESVPVYCELNTNAGNWLVSYFIITGLINNSFSFTLWQLSCN